MVCPNDQDRCPSTPVGAAVDMSGCPKDTDGDSVPDYMDKCPDTPEGIRVDEAGCKLENDDDGDGVLNEDDKCPGTPKGVRVNSAGCWVLTNLTFKTARWNIQDEHKSLLDEAVVYLLHHPDLKIEIQGSYGQSRSQTLQ